MPKPRKIEFFLLQLCIPLLIAFLLSLVITALNYGFGENFIRDWVKGFVVAIIVIPLGLRLIPFVSKCVSKLLGGRSILTMRCVVAICVAIMMESLVSLAITLAQRGLAPDWPYMWGLAFLQSLPVGLLIGFSMTFIVHPWMHRLGASAKDSAA